MLIKVSEYDYVLAEAIAAVREDQYAVTTELKNGQQYHVSTLTHSGLAATIVKKVNRALLAQLR